MPGEHPEAREQRVAAEPAVAADEEDRDRLLRVDLAAALGGSGAFGAGRQVLGAGQLVVEPPDRADDERRSGA